jgi:hypothetical protein
VQCLIIIGWPLIERKENWMALFNEAMVSIYLYVSMALTGFNVNSFFNMTGTVLMGVIISVASVNFLMFFFSSIKALYQSCR